MRAMFRALFETRALTERAGKKLGLPRGLEACWVGTAIDLQAGDVVSGLQAEVLGAYIRAVGTRKTDRAATKVEFRRAAERMSAARPFPGIASDAFCCAVGHATAMGAAASGNLVVAYVGVDELTATEWKRVLAVAHVGSLPLVVVTIPSIRVRAVGDVSEIARKIAGVSIPVIPVDAGDAGALYRVMQETCVRARADGGVAVIECVRFGTDPVKLLGDQMRKKGICTERWINEVEEDARALQLLL